MSNEHSLVSKVGVHFDIIDSVTTILVLLKYRMIEKECSENMNDAKGHGLECQQCISNVCEGSVKLPFTRVLNGEKQDVVFEARFATYFHRQHILK